MQYYDFYQLGRLIKRLYFEGGGLFFKNRENLDTSEKNLLRDCEIVNNKAYELSQKVKLSHLNIYWEQIFNTIENSIKFSNPKEFMKKLNNLYKQIDIAITESIFNNELKFYKLGIFLSQSWIYMVASKQFDMESELKSINIPREIIFEYKIINDILNKIILNIHTANIPDFNSNIDKLITEIKEIDINKKDIKNKIISVDNEYDLFISHASEDKESVVQPLVNELKELGIKVWYDKFTLRVGDSLREKIDEGLQKSRYGTIIISTSFIQKNWTEYEFNSMITKEMNGHKMILPIWHKITKDEVISFSLALADRVALNTSTNSIKEIAEQLADVINNKT